MRNLLDEIRKIPGPVLVIGASGFLGANLFRTLLKYRKDVFGTIHGQKAWRLEGIPSQHLLFLDLLSPESQQDVLARVQPATIFNCAAFGSYSFENNAELIHQTNYNATLCLLQKMEEISARAYVHAGSSSEYGLNCSAPKEEDALMPDSQYAISKGGAALAISYYGKVKKMPCVNLRLYSLYGPYEDSSRLMPVLAEKVLKETLPPFVEADVSRDFIHVDDVVAAFVMVAARMKEEAYGESYNVGTGVKTTIRDIAGIVCERFPLSVKPEFGTMADRAWDRKEWFADPSKIEKAFGWKAEIGLEAGVVETIQWWKAFLATHSFAKLTKKKSFAEKSSVSAIIACYKDGQAIPIMYERLKAVFSKLDLDYEIIFVNDCSPDNSSAQIQAISKKDAHVIGIVHSRNFGSQAGFRSGMEIASKEACVLLDGDLQDPPELIEKFVEKWRAGADIVYGKRVRREMPRWLEFCYKSFYKIFASVSEVKMPRDAGDFSLIDVRAMRWLLQCKERDFFLRGLRAYIGFKQESVDYVRPERMFGRSTNNLIKNIGWAKKAIFSFSRAPLHLLTALGFVATIASFLLGLFMVVSKLLFPDIAPHGITTLSLLIITFGALNLLGLGLLGEYIGKIIEEAKQRPAFIRVNRIAHGDVLPWKDQDD
jgi:polyisoprenyl-phosphate glycosyltransferase